MPIRIALACMVAVCSLVGASFAQAADDAKMTRDVQYGTAGETPLTLNMAASTKADDEPRPVVMFIHGGGWAAGNKDALPREILADSVRRGYLAVSVGYRLAPDHRFPAQVEDCKCAVRWLRAHAKEYNIIPNKIGAVGFSAGAHLAMMLAVMDQDDGLEGDGGWRDQSSKIQAAVAYFGPVNLDDEYPETSRNIVSNFIGGARSEQQAQYRRASPLTYVNAGDAPMLLFQGTEDVLVPYDQAVQMAHAMHANDIPGRIELMVGHNHGWGGAELKRTAEGTFAFLDDHLKSK